MSRKVAALLLGAALGVLVVGVLYLLRPPSSRRVADGPAAAPATAESAPAAAAEPPWEVKLYFPSTAGLLVPEVRELEGGGSPSEVASRLVRALLAGPTAEGLVPVLPAGVSLARALVMSDGTAYLDLRGPEGGGPPESGSEMELLRVFALVDTVIWNVPEAERVVLLWNGEQRPSLSGHVNTGAPLVANRQLLVSPP